jgi:hypothetical protein
MLKRDEIAEVVDVMEVVLHRRGLAIVPSSRIIAATEV